MANRSIRAVEKELSEFKDKYANALAAHTATLREYNALADEYNDHLEKYVSLQDKNLKLGLRLLCGMGAVHGLLLYIKQRG